MVLGFLAFLVWCIQQGEGFTKMHDKWGWGPDGLSLLHLFEAVHMFLFLGMVLNFILASVLISKITQWQILFSGYENPKLVEDHPGISAFHCDPPGFLQYNESSRESFMLLEKYFISAVQMQHPNINLESMDFSRYISICMDEVLTDVIHFSDATWLFVLFVFLIHGVTTYVFEYDTHVKKGWAEFQLAIITAACPITAATMALSSRYDILTIIKAAMNGDFEAQPAWVTYCVSKERLRVAQFQVVAARLLEGLMFVSAYGLMRKVSDKDFWTFSNARYGDNENDGDYGEDYVFGLLTVAYYLIIYCVVGWKVVPEALVSATVCFALPPYVDDSNWAIALCCVAHADEVEQCRTSESRAQLREHVKAAALFGPMHGTPDGSPALAATIPDPTMPSVAEVSLQEVTVEVTVADRSV